MKRAGVVILFVFDLLSLKVDWWKVSWEKALPNDKFCWAGFVGVAPGDSGKRLMLSLPVVVLLSDELHHSKSSSRVTVFILGEGVLGSLICLHRL